MLVGAENSTTDYTDGTDKNFGAATGHPDVGRRVWPGVTSGKILRRTQNDDWGIGVKLVRRNEGRVGAPWAGATVGFRLWLP
jgi:hypothetical protein